MQAAQVAESEAPSQPVANNEPKPVRCALSADGAMISLLKKQWVEVRTLAIGVPKRGRGTNAEQEIHVDQLSYFSQLADACTFTRLSAREIQRRRVAEAEAVCAVTDGADWCQTFIEAHRPDAVRILDFPHAAEHASQLLEAFEQAGTHFPERMLERCLHILKHRGPRALLQILSHLPNALAQQKGIQEHVDYLRKREASMDYPTFRAQGWPIGSGMVESANKNVVQARLKGPGMHWERTHVNPLLALRMAVCNERWQEMWLKALHHVRVQQGKRSTGSSQPLGWSEPSAGPLSASQHPGESDAQPAQQRRLVSPPRSALPQEGGKHQRADAVCLCGTPLALLPGQRSKEYCSARCRMRAYRKRSLLNSSPRQHCASPFIKQRADACPCGAPLVPLPGRRRRDYCSDRCRMRAYRWRQTQGT